MAKTNNDLIVQMRKDLFAAYRDVTSKPCPTQMLAFVRTAKHKAPRYYVDTNKATRVMYWIANREFHNLDSMHKKNRERYISLYHEVVRLSQKLEFQGKSLPYIVSHAIRQPAPEFFIGWEAVKKIFRNAKRYGIDFNFVEAYEKNKAYTNNKDNKGSDAVFTGKKFLLMNM